MQYAFAPSTATKMTLDDETYADVLHLATKGENPRHQAPRAVIWDAKAGAKLPTADSPPLNQLQNFLAAHPHCEVFNGQQPPLKRLASDDDILPLKKKVVKAAAFNLVWEEMNPQLDEPAADEEEDEEDEGDEDEVVLSSLREENPQAFLEWSCR